MARRHEEREERRQEDGDDGPEDRSRVHRPGQPGPVVAADGVAPGGGHELARLGLRGAGLGALAARVARPELLAGQEPVAQAHLRVADHSPRERGVVGDERTGRGARPAGEAGRDIGRAELLELSVEPNVNLRGHARSSAWYRK